MRPDDAAVRVRGPAASLLLAATLLAGCNGSSGSEEREQSSYANRGASEVPSASGIPAEYRRFPDGQAGPPTKDPRVPASSGCLSMRSGDFDGNGRTDQWLVYAHPLGATGHPLAWHTRVILGSAKALDSRIANPAAGTNLWIFGATDANADEKDEAFIRLNAGASTSTVGVFYVRSGRIKRVFKGNEPLALVVGGAPLFGSGARCEKVDGDRRLDLVVTSVSSKRGRLYQWTKRAYKWRGHSLSRFTVHRGVIEVRGPAGSSRLRPFSVLRCQSVFLY
jgi:hypothetical protein